MRVGIGYDIHKLVSGKPLLLGGVRVPHSKGLQGHSDGDVILHAISDAALGAAGLGDIGDHFSDEDPRWKGADSALFAKEVVRLLAQKRLKICQVDSIVIAEQPKLGVLKLKIRESIARCFRLPVADVGLKAKTHEGLDAVGLKKAIACHAVVLLKKI